MTLTMEGWYPFVCGLMAGTLAGFLMGTPNDPFIATLSGHGINVAAIAVGFLATALSILVSIELARVVQMLRDADYYSIVLSYLGAPIRLWFLVALFSAGLLVAWQRVPCVYQRLGFAAWIFMVAWASTATYRITAVLAKILQRPA